MNVETKMVEVPTSAGAMPAFEARPAGAARLPAVLVIQEAFGLNAHIKDVARRLAAEGYVALGPDLYWRGGRGRTVRYDQLPEAIGLMQSLQDDEILADVAGAITHLERNAGVQADRIGITGFCMGGRVSYFAACALPAKIKACVPFYGGGIPVDRTPSLRAPVLAFFGAEDGFIPPDSVEALRAALAKHGKQAEVIVYPKAGHGFFCDERESYHADSARDAWARTTKFLARHLKG